MKMQLKSFGGGVFPNEATFQRIYEECLENEPQASQTLRNSCKELNLAFENYLAEYNEHMFRYAYQCGYEAGRKGGAAVC